MRRFAVLLAATMAVAAVGYSTLWYYFARSLEAQLPAWAEAQRAQGYNVGWRTAEVGGFPLALKVDFSGASLRTARPFPYAVHADALGIATRPWDWRRWRFTAPEGAHLDIEGGPGFNLARIDGTVGDDGDGLAMSTTGMSLDGTGIAAGLSAAALDFRLNLPPNPPRADRDPLAAVSAKLADLTLPRAPEAVRRLDALDLALTLRGVLPPGPLQAALAAWRDGGGTLDLDRLRLARGGAIADLEGTLALDAALQPEGALTATLSGTDALVDDLVTAGALKARFAGVAKAMLGAIATTGAHGTIRVPI
ncbi:MAG: DUF2125 domain-containing protein, partial [Stellaceae bacterium]